MFGCCCLAAIQDRGFDFGFATQVFSDPAGFKERDQRFLYGEDRFRFYGEIQAHVQRRADAPEG